MNELEWRKNIKKGDRIDAIMFHAQHYTVIPHWAPATVISIKSNSNEYNNYTLSLHPDIEIPEHGELN